MTVQNVEKCNIQKEGKAILFGFRLLTEEEQRIAYAILEGMQLQKHLDAQRKEAGAESIENNVAFRAAQ